MMDLVYLSRALQADHAHDAAKRRLIRLATEPSVEDAAPARRLLDPARNPAGCESAAAVTMRCCAIGGCV